jgi:hypothetical protein
MKKLQILLIFLTLSLFVYSQEWSYPMRPGTKEWIELGTYKERIDAYNIPDDLLQRMNTKDLVQTCLNYPEFRLIMTRNSLQKGYDYLKSIFNGFRELEKRDDAGIELLNAYEKLNPSIISQFEKPAEKGAYSFKFIYLEILLAQKPILRNMNNSETIKLIEHCISNYRIFEKMPDFYGTFSLSTPALVLGRVLDVKEYSVYKSKKSKNDYFTHFINNTQLTDRQILSDIITLSKQYLNQLKNE